MECINKAYNDNVLIMNKKNAIIIGEICKKSHYYGKKCHVYCPLKNENVCIFNMIFFFFNIIFFFFFILNLVMGLVSFKK